MHHWLLKLKIAAAFHPIFVEKHDTLPRLFEQELEDGDILLMQGAGNIGGLAANLAATQLKEIKV